MVVVPVCLPITPPVPEDRGHHRGGQGPHPRPPPRPPRPPPPRPAPGRAGPPPRDPLCPSQAHGLALRGGRPGAGPVPDRSLVALEQPRRGRRGDLAPRQRLPGRLSIRVVADLVLQPAALG